MPDETGNENPLEIGSQLTDQLEAFEKETLEDLEGLPGGSDPEGIYEDDADEQAGQEEDIEGSDDEDEDSAADSEPSSEDDDVDQEDVEDGDGEEPEGSQPEAPTYDDATVIRAARLGMTPEMMRMFTPAGLQFVVAEGERNAATAAAQPPANGTPAEPDKSKKYDVGLDPEEFEPDYVNAMQRMADHFEARLANVSSAPPTELLQELRDVRQKLEQTKFDQWISNKGDDMADLFGAGPTEALEMSSKTFINRDKVYSKALEFKKVQPGLSDWAAYDQANIAVNGQHAQRSARREVRSKLKKNAKSLTTRPAKRKRKSQIKDPDKRAEAAVASYFQEIGVEPSY